MDECDIVASRKAFAIEGVIWLCRDAVDAGDDDESREESATKSLHRVAAVC